MPVETEMNVPAREIVKGDWVFDQFTGLDSTQDCIAHEVKPGYKYVTVKNANGQILSRREPNYKVSIERMVPTEEEIAAKQAEHDREAREFFAADVEKWVNSTINGWADVVADSAKILVEFPGQTYHSPIDTLMNGGARVIIARRIEQIFLDGHATDWADAYDKWAETARDTLVKGIGMSSNALSRSSGIITNLTDDVYAANLRKILEASKHGYFRVW